MLILKVGSCFVVFLFGTLPSLIFCVRGNSNLISASRTRDDSQTIIVGPPRMLTMTQYTFVIAKCALATNHVGVRSLPYFREKDGKFANFRRECILRLIQRYVPSKSTRKISRFGKISSKSPIWLDAAGM